MSSLFGKLFGAPPPPRAPQDSTTVTANAIQRLQGAIEMLNKKSEHLDKKIRDELIAAKKCGTKNKQQALLHLKKKARYQKQQAAIEGQRESLETQMMGLEMTASNTEVFQAMNVGNQAMHATQANADQVLDLMDDVRDQMDQQNEVTDALADSNALGMGLDEDELLAELEGMEQEDLDAKLSEVSTNGVELPDVPSADLARPAAAKPAKEKDELDELSAWAL